MRVLRVLVPLVLFSACAAAQSSSRVVVMWSAPVQSQPAPQVPDFQLSPVTPQVGLMGRSLSTSGMAQLSLPQVLVGQASSPRILSLTPNAQNNGVCYAIRSYDFAREGADSDAMRWTGSSTCRPSSKIKLKGAVQLKSIR